MVDPALLDSVNALLTDSVNAGLPDSVNADPLRLPVSVNAHIHDWLRHYASRGLAGLADRSSKPASCPHRRGRAMTELCPSRRLPWEASPPSART